MTPPHRDDRERDDRERDDRDSQGAARLSALVSGRVQGVGYRAFARRLARDLRLAGYAENLSDGRVEIVAEGPRGELEAFAQQLKRGPAHAEVAALELAWGASSGLEDFYVY